jgi:hypothetical protein
MTEQERSDAIARFLEMPVADHMMARRRAALLYCLAQMNHDRSLRNAPRDGRA